MVLHGPIKFQPATFFCYLALLHDMIFQRGLEQKDFVTTSQITKKLKTEAKAANSFQFKGNKLQFEFNSTLLDSIDSVSAHLLEGTFAKETE